jgi:hypothetical protein
MCNFFSVVSNGDGKPLYFDYEIRKKILKKELPYENPDSHTSTADYYGFKGKKEDKLNKYEFNPITGEFVIDQLNNPIDDSKEIEKFCRNLDFKTIVPELIVHPIINPFEDKHKTKVDETDLELLRKWASIRDSVWASVWASVWDSVRASVWDSVLDSVWFSVRASVRDSVRASVWASVRDSVWDSVRAYISSFFNLQEWKYIKHEPGENPFQPGIDLWNRGLVPSFDGKTWRLHGKDGMIIWEGCCIEIV